MDGDGRIPYGGSLGCLPAPCCPVSASCSARDLLLSHRSRSVWHTILTCSGSMSIFILLLPVAINPCKAYSTAVHRFRHDPCMIAV